MASMWVAWPWADPQLALHATYACPNLLHFYRLRLLLRYLLGRSWEEAKQKQALTAFCPAALVWAGPLGLLGPLAAHANGRWRAA